MRTLPILAILAALGAGTASAQPQDDGRMPPPPPRPVIVSTGTSTVRMAPDRAFIVLATETVSPRPADAQQNNARSMASVRASLQKAQVPDAAIRTLSYSLNEDYEWVNGRRNSRGFRAVNVIEIRVDDLARVGAIVDAAVQAGAARVQNIRFDLKNRDAAEREALRQAVADARARAEAMAAGAGVALGAVIRIDEQGGRPIPMPQAPVMAMRAAADAAPETSVTPGEIEIAATVTLTAAIK